jgi:hypothetical protein
MSFVGLMPQRPPADATADPAGLNSLMKKTRTVTVALIAAFSIAALTGCSSIQGALQKESSVEFDTAADVADAWDRTAPWLPEDATDIRIQQATEGDPAVLLATSDAELDPALCAETDRQSAATFTVDGAPDSYAADSVLACGDWAVIPTDDGWYGWTPNHPNEKAVSLELQSK